MGFRSMTSFYQQSLLTIRVELEEKKAMAAVKLEASGRKR